MRLDANYNIPLPVTLNCWKHHVGFIKNRVDVIGRTDISDLELKKLLLIIGNSQMDIYLGEFSPVTIANEIIDKLNNLGLCSAKEYKSWLSENNKGFKLITISDESFWALRIGKQSDRYVHIHPGRYSPHTVRAKSLTLKTTIAVIIRLKNSGKISLDIESINSIRKNILGMSPLKSLHYSSGLGKLMSIFGGVKD